MSVTMIAAMDRNRTIGIGNRLPWRLPAEMAYFVAQTKGKTVLMGRKTFESLKKPLSDRLNVVLTRQSGLKLEGCEIVHTAEEALERYGSAGELMVIGGAEVYKLMMPYADKLLLTEVDVEIAGGDAFFPEISPKQWRLADSAFRPKDEKNSYDFTFQTYIRV